MSSGGRALNGLGGIALTEPYQTPNATYFELGSQTTNDKIRGQKGNSPESSAKVPKCKLSGKGCEISKTTRMLA